MQGTIYDSTANISSGIQLMNNVLYDIVLRTRYDYRPSRNPFKLQQLYDTSVHF